MPLACLVSLTVFAALLFSRQLRSTKERGGDTKDHSERIYKDFDMYLKVALGLTAAFGYIRIKEFANNPGLGRQALWAIGAISLFVMMVFCVFVICHLGSKLRRWENIEWGLSPFWQELWACLAMWLFSSGIWVAACKW
jgi:hypothetical protein